MVRSTLLILILAICGVAEAAPAPVLQFLRTRPGFRVEIFAERIPGARGLAEGPEGSVLVGSTTGEVRAVLPGGEVKTLISGLKLPLGIDYRNGALFTSSVDRIIRFDGVTAIHPPLGKPVTIVSGLPSSPVHGGRYLRIGPDQRLYFAVGAPCNICIPGRNEATLQSVRLDGTDLRVEATGIRNTVGFDWSPENHELWFTENGRDFLGDNAPPDELNRLRARGMNFGFPFCHGGTLVDPGFRSKPCSEFEPPAFPLPAHVAPLGIRFYQGGQFPKEYQGDLFMAQHGSWNRSSKVGYKVVRIRFRNGRAISEETFIEGWLRTTDRKDEVLGRPVDILIRRDGSMLISDDFGGRIFRVSYALPH